MEIAIVNYGMGNLRSVANAFEALGCPASVVDDPAKLREARRIVLPGVGAFGDGMQNLRTRGWVEALEEEVRQKGKPFLGLCLGLQLLATAGTEHGRHAGLDWVPGVVERIRNDDSLIRVPHVGWNTVHVSGRARLYEGLGESQTFYFVHSYVLRPERSECVTGSCFYGGEFAASIELGNIYATQFHPEKSQGAGLTVLRNFLQVEA